VDAEGRSSDTHVEVQPENLKTVFLVKTFEGDRNYRGKTEFLDEDQPSGGKIEVTFLDGEKIRGSTLGHSAERCGFFLFPADPNSDNSNIFVVFSAIRNFYFR
jgi:hypothetical protein